MTIMEFYQEEYGLLAEKLITFAGQAYPKFGNVIIMAGGAGSGKGFVKDKLVGAEGFTFDVDALKTMASKTPAILAKVKAERGIDMAELASDLKNPANVSKLHEIIGGYLNLDNKKLNAIYTSIITAAPDRKPNLIFDVTLKDLHKFDNLTRQVRELGYSNDRIHIVWVVNDVEVAKAQNEKRDRTVPVEILINTHRGVSSTMHDIFNMGKQLKKYMDGDLVIAFNKVGVDSEVVAGEKKDNVAFSNRKAGSAMYVKAANYFYLKRAGKDIIPFNDIQKDIRSKIASYVPDSVVWEGFDPHESITESVGISNWEEVPNMYHHTIEIFLKTLRPMFPKLVIGYLPSKEAIQVSVGRKWNSPEEKLDVVKKILSATNEKFNGLWWELREKGEERWNKRNGLVQLFPDPKNITNAPKLVKEAVEELEEGVGKIAVKAVKLDKVKIPVKGGYTLFTGWTVRRTDNGEFYTINGETPWNPKGGEQSAKEVEASGLLPNAKFIKLANAPKLVKESVEELEEAVKFVKDPVNKDPQFDRFFVMKDNNPLGYVEVTGPDYGVFSPNGKFLGHVVGKNAAIKKLESIKEGIETVSLDEGYFKMHPDDQYSYTVWKKDLYTGKLSHKEHLDNSSELEDWMQKALGKHATVLVKQDQTGKEITYTDNGQKFEIIDKKK